MKLKYSILFILLASLLAGCDYSTQESKTGFFYNTFAVPVDHLLHWLGGLFNNNYGLAIIAIVLIVRIIMLPFMLAQSKNGHLMRKKMDIIKPEMKQIQEEVKHARTQEEKMQANQKMMEKYKEYGLNPIKNMLGCLPLLVQMPILYGLYISLRWPSNGGIAAHSDFLWLNLTHSDIWITIIAGVLYIFQPLINIENMPKEQKSMGYMMAVISPIFIIFVSLHSPSALGLYWSVNAAFLIIQMYFANKHYSKVADHEAQILRDKIDQKAKM